MDSDMEPVSMSQNKVISTLDNGKMMDFQAKVSLSSQMDNDMKDKWSMELEKDKEPSTTVMAEFIEAPGIMIKEMDMELKKEFIIMKGNGKMIRNKDKEW